MDHSKEYFNLYNNLNIPEEIEDADIDLYNKIDLIIAKNTIGNAINKLIEQYNLTCNLSYVEVFVKHVYYSIYGKPRYEHNCNSCEYLGNVFEYDVYFCSGEPTIILRYGNKGPEYSSGLMFAGRRYNQLVGDINRRFGYLRGAYWAIEKDLLRSDWDNGI